MQFPPLPFQLAHAFRRLSMIGIGLQHVIQWNPEPRCFFTMMHCCK